MINWVKTSTNGDNQLRVVYRGPLAGSDLRLHYGFDGWQEPTQESRLEEIEPGLAITEPVDERLFHPSELRAQARKSLTTAGGSFSVIPL